MKNKSNKLIKFVKTVIKVAKKSIPPYSCKFSNHIYTQYQHLSILSIKKRLRLKYREVVELLELMPGVRKILKLKRVPHFSALQKFFSRISSSLFDRIFNESVKLFDIKDPWVAIDSTGHSSSHASTYYAKKLKKQKKKKRKGYTKNSIAVDTEKQAIVAQRVRKGPKNDNRDSVPMIRKTHRRVKPKGYSMDKGYDAEKNHKVIRRECRAESMIPIRERKRKKVRGKYRRLMLKEFDEEKYHRRSISETVISVEKRVFGDTLCSRSDRLRNKEVKLKNFTYNIYRYVKIFILEILRISTELIFLTILYFKE